MKTKKIYASLREDVQQGWVWLLDPSLPPRSVVKILNISTGKSIYCEALQIDSNFLDFYNNPSRFKISSPDEALVISQWYRASLGGLSTQSTVKLIIKPCNSFFGKFLACIHHPQIVVRVAAWLGFVSILLGLLSLVLA